MVNNDKPDTTVSDNTIHYETVHYRYPYYICKRTSFIIGSTQCIDCKNYLGEETDHYGESYVKCITD